MTFFPKLENDFAFFIHTYYEECRSRFEKIEAIAGKWMFRDLIPGMSDFDTRFIVSGDMTPEDWCRMSTAVGQAHLALCRRVPAWARILEHLPGVNVTWNELMSERAYYPEYQQWTFYHSEDSRKVSEALEYLGNRPMDTKDEYFHLKKFCYFFGRYNRTIDPPINLGVHASKYPLHSRLMHYFTPPVHSAMILLEKRPFVGKFEALEVATLRFPKLKCWDYLWEILQANYIVPKWYEEPYLIKLEDALEEGLKAIRDALRDVITLVPEEAGTDVAAWKNALASAPVDPAMKIFDNAKFCRLMKGRLHYYSHAPPHFDATWLIRNELGRIGHNFFTIPFQVYWRIVRGAAVANPVDILEQLRGNLLSDDEIEAVKEFHRLTATPCEAGKEHQTAREITMVFDRFFHSLWKISDAVSGQQNTPT